METGTWLIPLLILVSGVIAFIGNMVGRAVGRGRLTLFGLRPRITAEIVTLVSGMLIAITTVGVILLTIEDARTALLRSRELREEIRLLESQVKSLKQQADLLRTQRIAFLLDQEIWREVVDPRAAREVVAARLDLAREHAEEIGLNRGARPDAQGNVFVFALPGYSWSDLVDLLVKRARPTIVRVVASENTIQGTPVKITPILLDNTLAYKPGKVIASGSVDGRADRQTIGDALDRLLDQAAVAASRIMLSAPGQPLNWPPAVVKSVENQRAVINEMQHLGRPATVRVVVAATAYTVGPLELRFVLASPASRSP